MEIWCLVGARVLGTLASMSCSRRLPKGFWRLVRGREWRCVLEPESH